MKQILATLLLMVASLFAEGSVSDTATTQRFLHLSTIPSKADIYINNLHPNFATSPEYTSPEFIPINESDLSDGSILISLFKQDFADTTIKVNLSAKDTSYLIVSLRTSYDEDYIEMQKDLVAKRSRKNLGTRLLFSSILPFSISAISGIVSVYQIGQANDAKDIVNKTTISGGKKFNQAQRDFKEHRDKAESAQKITAVGLVAGGVLAAVGLVFQF